MDHTAELARRIEALETQNRRQKRALRLLFVAGALGLATSMAAPPVCKTIWGERFVLKDGSMRERMVLDAYGQQTPTLTFKDIEGQKVAELKVGDDGEMSLDVFKGGQKASAHFEVVPDEVDEGSSVR